MNVLGKQIIIWMLDWSNIEMVNVQNPHWYNGLIHVICFMQRIVFKINLISHKVLNGTAPRYLQELLNRYGAATPTSIVKR